MSAETYKYLRQTYLPAHRYWESTARAAAFVGTRHTSSQIRGISASITTPQINHRWSSFSGESTRAEEVAAVMEGESEASAAAYPWARADVTGVGPVHLRR